MAENSLTRMVSQSTNDRVLIILQLSRPATTGLNSVIPVTTMICITAARQYCHPSKNQYTENDPLDSTLASDAQVGLHPDMVGMKDLYDRARMTIVQGVSYKIITARTSADGISISWAAVLTTIFLPDG